MSVIQPGELAFLETARVARLATIGRDGVPSLVPICFAIAGMSPPAIASVLDDKPKRVTDGELARVRNIRRDPRVRMLVDHYEEDWSRLAFVQVAGVARIVEPGAPGHAESIVVLREKYPQYRAMAIETRTVIVIEHLHIRSWGLDDAQPRDDAAPPCDGG